MRCILIGMVLCAVVVAPAHILAQKVGDTVVVVRETPIKMGDKVVGTLTEGETPVIEDVNGDWLWVDYGQYTPGWIQKQNVESLEDGIRRYTAMIRQNPSDSVAYCIRAAIWEAKGEYDIALKDYDDALRLDPHPYNYYGRGAVRAEKEDYDGAVADYNEAARLNPTYINPVCGRGVVRCLQKEYDKALADFNQVIKMAPDNTFGYLGRGWAHEGQGQYDKALADYQQTLELNPKSPDAVRCIALVQAACPDAKYRDGKKALQTATSACEMTGWKNSDCLDVLAAAYAENGLFEKAVEYAVKSLEREKSPYGKRKVAERLELYRQKKPFRLQPENE